jgi:hypothetical protein
MNRISVFGKIERNSFEKSMFFRKTLKLRLSELLCKQDKCFRKDRKTLFMKTMFFRNTILKLSLSEYLCEKDKCGAG